MFGNRDELLLALYLGSIGALMLAVILSNAGGKFWRVIAFGTISSPFNVIIWVPLLAYRPWMALLVLSVGLAHSVVAEAIAILLFRKPTSKANAS